MNTRFLLLIGMAGILCLNAPAKAQYQVYPADARIEPVQNQKNHKTGPAPAETSLFYCLPQNDIKIKVVLQKTTYTRGLYSDYAEQMLKLPAFPDKQESYRIERIELHTEAIPDPTQVFCVQGAKLPKMDINPDGILLSVNRNEAIPSTGPHPAFQPQEAPGPAQAPSPEWRRNLILRSACRFYYPVCTEWSPTLRMSFQMSLSYALPPVCQKPAQKGQASS